MSPFDLDAEQCWRACEGRDARFDGRFIVGVRTTGIYCRPSCPTPVAAQAPQRRLLPHRGRRPARRAARVQALPARRDARLAGVGRARRPRRPRDAPDRRRRRGSRRRRRPGARGSAYSERHLHRLLVEAVGAPPLALARSQRAQTARVLIETTPMPFAEVAFAAGSRRSASSTTRSARCSRRRRPQLRRAPPRRGRRAANGALARAPAVPRALRRRRRARLARRARRARGRGGRRRRLPPHAGAARRPGRRRARAARRPRRGALHARDRSPTSPRRCTACRRLLDLDADPRLHNEPLAADPALAPSVAARPGPAGARHASTPPRPRCAPCSASRSRSPAARTLAGRLDGARSARRCPSPTARSRTCSRRRRRWPRRATSRWRCRARAGTRCASWRGASTRASSC